MAPLPFWPDTPITIAYAVALAVASVVALWREHRSAPLVLFMIANWIGTRTITSQELGPYAAFFLDLSTAAAILLFSRLTMAYVPVAAIFAFMVVSYLLNDFGVIGRETMWAFADVGGYIQLLLMAGLTRGGSGLAILGSVRGGGNRVAGPMAPRFQARTNPGADRVGIE